MTYRLIQRAEDLGYVHISCRLCGWNDWTDTGICGGCVFCPECGKVCDPESEDPCCEPEEDPEGEESNDAS